MCGRAGGVQTPVRWLVRGRGLLDRAGSEEFEMNPRIGRWVVCVPLSGPHVKGSLDAWSHIFSLKNPNFPRFSVPASFPSPF